MTIRLLHQRLPYRVWLLVGFLFILCLSSIGAQSSDFALQHVLTVMLLAALVSTGMRNPLSNVSYTLLFMYLLLHVVGARYTYSYVPYDEWSEALFGYEITARHHFARNHYDRLVHFSFGLLLFQPMREVIDRVIRVDRIWSITIAIGAIIVFGTIYELIEWVFALILSPEAAETYNGQQGDVWDAHADMALAMGGAVISAVSIPIASCARRACEYNKERWICSYLLQPVG